MTRTVIATPHAPAAVGPYSQAIRSGNLVFTAGQIGLDPSTGKVVEGLENQVEQVLANLRAVLAAAGSSLDQAVKTTIFLADMADFAQVNAIYGQRVHCDAASAFDDSGRRIAAGRAGRNRGHRPGWRLNRTRTERIWRGPTNLRLASSGRLLFAHISGIISRTP